MTRFSGAASGRINLPASNLDHWVKVRDELRVICKQLDTHFDYMSYHHEMGEKVVATPLYLDMDGMRYGYGTPIHPAHSFRSLVIMAGWGGWEKLVSEDAKPPYTRADWRELLKSPNGYITCLDHPDFARADNIDVATRVHIGDNCAWSRVDEHWGVINQEYMMRLKYQLLWLAKMITAALREHNVTA
ncbi:hypothetical protein [Delftia phage PhiW-14]|uniref:Uncharacterized protein n=1 Tax=Delftia phage PhiW-14 TaxID=665032 RepID=C9DGG0_BPW14|nr:hypothetical protein DP-phiW-14_gp190 [Delftia phage PhiW-14]ACV50211.1 hypothetical protein [Delftia phage PhiW-14]